MQRPDRRARIARGLLYWLAFVGMVFSRTGVAIAQSDMTEELRPQETRRFDEIERWLESITEENRRMSEEMRRLEERLKDRSANDSPASEERSSNAEQRGDASTAQSTRSDEDDDDDDGFRVRYDRGFKIEANNKEKNPFSLKIRSQNYFRYNDFSNDEDFWVDSAGNVNPITPNRSFQIPRGRLIFSGTTLLPKLTYLLNIDYNTVTSNPIGFRAYVLSYRFDRAFRLSVGQSKVPGSREWLESASAALEGADRTMATTFFRPSLSQGIWVTGEPLDQFHYHVMVSNGFNTLNLRPVQFDDRFCWSTSIWWEPWGDFGRGYSDYEHHEQPVMRVGGAYTFALGEGSETLSSAVENSLIRLSDGTLLTQVGALAPDVTLQSFDLGLAAIDLSFKFRGFSLSTEVYAQNLASLQGDGPLPIDSTQAYGGFLQGGYFICPKRVQLYGRTSFVTGQFGSGSEMGTGVSWFVLPGKSNLRCTFDITWLESSPADQNRTGFFAGQTGILIRPQIVASY